MPKTGKFGKVAVIEAAPPVAAVAACLRARVQGVHGLPELWQAYELQLALEEQAAFETEQYPAAHPVGVAEALQDLPLMEQNCAVQYCAAAQSWPEE